MKKAIMFLLLLSVAIPCFSFSYNPEGKEEFCFSPCSYPIYDNYLLEHSAFYEDSFLYRDFYSSIDIAINASHFETFKRAFKSGLWYWDYVLTKGYFDEQILCDSKGETINDSKYDYYSVVLENGESYIYKCLKGQKYSPASEGLFVIRPIELYRPVIEKAPFVPGSWISVVGCDSELKYYPDYILSNGNVINSKTLSLLIIVTSHITDDSIRLKLSELVTFLKNPDIDYDKDQNIIWIQMCDLTSGRLNGFPLIGYVGYSVDTGYLLPRLIFLLQDENIQSIVIGYDNKEWNAYDSLNPSFNPAGKEGYYYSDSWIGDYIKTLRDIISAKDVRMRIKTGNDYKMLTISDENKIQLGYILDIYEKLK